MKSYLGVVLPIHESKRECVRILSVKNNKATKKKKKLADGFQFIDNFLLLYASVLEPYCDLSLGQVGLGRYPPPFVLRDKFVGGVLALQFL